MCAGSAAPGEAAHPPTRVAGVGVEVVGDLAHDRIDVEPTLAEALGADALQGGEHVGPLVLGGLGAVPLPDDHGDSADLALGDPADVVLVEPRRDARRLAELAVAARPCHRGRLPPSGVACPLQPPSRADRNSATNDAAPSGPAPSSSRRTRAEPTITPSASADTSTACSGVETPTPINTGRSVTSLRRLAIVAAEVASDARSPVTPISPTPYTQPRQRAQMSTKRSSGVVGAASSTVSTPAS